MGNQSVISIEAVIDYIESHLDGKLELETVAEAVHYSKYHLHRLFTDTVGMTIHDYVQRRQLTEAAKLLAFSDKPIIEIAFICGYESQQSFSLAFKAMYKSPPAEYRENRSFYPLQLRFTLHRKPAAMEFTMQDIRLAKRDDISDWMNLMQLTNPIYTGDLVQGRRRVKSYKVHEIEAVPEDEWVRVADTHEAIIDRETFEKVQALLKRDTRTAPRKKELHLFSGFLRCADCGKSITRSQSGKNVYYACSTYKYRSRAACSMHSIKHERLEAAVLFAVRQQVHLAVSFSEILARINSAPVKKSQSFRLDDLIAAKEKELAKIARYKQSLYQDWKDGEITQQDYRTMKADYERQISSLSDVLERLTAERAELANGVDSEHPALVAFKKHQNIETLNREILIDLVNYIKVYENGNISVKCKFADEFRRIAEYIEINISEIPAATG